MLCVVDPMDPTPLYKQVADILAARIAAGGIAAGNPLPSETAIRQEFGVARGTARAAVAELRRRGLVVTIPARGTFVK